MKNSIRRNETFLYLMTLKWLTYLINTILLLSWRPKVAQQERAEWMDAKWKDLSTLQIYITQLVYRRNFLLCKLDLLRANVSFDFDSVCTIVVCRVPQNLAEILNVYWSLAPFHCWFTVAHSAVQIAGITGVDRYFYNLHKSTVCHPLYTFATPTVPFSTLKKCYIIWRNFVQRSFGRRIIISREKDSFLCFISVEWE